MFVTNHGPDKGLYVVDTATNAVTPIIVGEFPFHVAVSADGGRVYMTDRYTNNVGKVFVFNAATNALIETLTGAPHPRAVAVDPGGARIFITAEPGDPSVEPTIVSAIDPATNTVTDTIALGHGAAAVAVHPDGFPVYVSNPFDHTVSVIGQVFRLPGKLQDLVGDVIGGVSGDGGGWIVIGNHFYRVPPRQPLLARALADFAHAVAPFVGRPIENRKLGEQLRKMV